MKAQLPKHKRQQRAKHGESFPVLILGPHIEGESGDLSGLLGLYETVPNLSCQTCILEISEVPGGEEEQRFVKTVYFFSVPLEKKNLILFIEGSFQDLNSVFISFIPPVRRF